MEVMSLASSSKALAGCGKLGGLGRAGTGM